MKNKLIVACYCKQELAEIKDRNLITPYEGTEPVFNCKTLAVVVECPKCGTIKTISPNSKYEKVKNVQVDQDDS